MLWWRTHWIFSEVNFQALSSTFRTQTKPAEAWHLIKEAQCTLMKLNLSILRVFRVTCWNNVIKVSAPNYNWILYTQQNSSINLLRHVHYTWGSIKILIFSGHYCQIKVSQSTLIHSVVEKTSLSWNFFLACDGDRHWNVIFIGDFICLMEYILKRLWI